MKKILKRAFLFVVGFSLTGMSACAFDINSYDFSVEVKVHDTESSVVTEPQKMDTELNSIDLAKKMGHGINLGNTLEAYRGWSAWNNNTSTEVLTSKNPTYYETLWGQPVTSQAIMDAYKAAGFDSVRIPVAWTNMTNYEDGDYEIADAWLDRVEEVVNYALKADLYVIINDHWDGQWWGLFGSANQGDREKAIVIYKSLWTQIANRFKNYDERLIFEGANEELGGRLNDDTALSNGKKGILTADQCYGVTNKINQCFVNLVRSTGGNNANRFLLIPGYDTDIDKTSNIKFIMPSDTASGRLLVSVHYYTPSTLCILSEKASWGACKLTWGTEAEKTYMERNFQKMIKFTKNGYGVIIGEYGVAKKKEADGSYTMKEGTIPWMKSVVENCDKYGFVPMLWDCNTFFQKKGTLGFDNEEMAAIYKK